MGSGSLGRAPLIHVNWVSVLEPVTKPNAAIFESFWGGVRGGFFCRKGLPGKLFPKNRPIWVEKKPSACVAGAEGEEGMDPCAVQWKDEGGLKTSCRTFGTERCIDEVLGKSVGLAVP